jgi:uncharacterized membrane protein YphA (DoxX/SURF4 family)
VDPGAVTREQTALTGTHAVIADPLLVITARAFLGMLFLSAALHKAAHYAHFKAAMTAYELFPARFSPWIAAPLLASELTTGLWLLSGISIRFVAAGAMLISGVYFVAMAANLMRGKTDVDCGCSFSRRKGRLSSWHLLRNGVLIGIAALLSLPQTDRVLHAFDGVQLVAAVAVLALVYLSTDSLLSNRSRLSREGA